MVKTKPPSPSSEPVLSRILREAWEYSQSGRRMLAIFDLDSTLFDLTLRVIAIVEDFRRNHANMALFPDECRRLENLPILQTDWGLETPLQRVGIATDGHFFQALHRHWAETFFSNDYLLHDKPLPGAVSYVQELHQVGANLMYLTGRDTARMGRGTHDSLKSRSFPIDTANVELVLKPNMKMEDAPFKLDVIKAAEETYDRIWLFENEPVNLNLVARECPEVGLVFIDSTHSGREELAAVLDRIKHFECDLEEFRQYRTSARR